ncbi:MAG TPA: ureidoglycolate lyase [Burkholderiaceae bacterium]|nr:ureidoglycolate lyase [Burkholderiaceae bacterium]
MHLPNPAPTLQSCPLTAEAFAPFGSVVEGFAPPGTPGAAPPPGARAINDGTTWRLDLTHDLDLQREGGTPGLAIYSAAARQFPFMLEVLERHELGSQGFLPLTGARFVVVVAAAGTAPGIEDLKAFHTTGQQGVVLHPGTWHHALLAVEAGSFAVIERHLAPNGHATDHATDHTMARPVDCGLATLSAPVRLEAPFRLR